MEFIPVKCNQCGAKIELESTKEAGICKYCGTAFITEKEMNLYNTYSINNNTFIGAKVDIKDYNDFNILIERANIYAKLNKPTEELRILYEITKKYPENYLGWVALSERMEDSLTSKYVYLKNAVLVAPDNKKSEVENKMNIIYDELNKQLQEFVFFVNNIENLNHVYTQNKNVLLGFEVIDSELYWVNCKFKHSTKSSNRFVFNRVKVDYEIIKNSDMSFLLEFYYHGSKECVKYNDIYDELLYDKHKCGFWFSYHDYLDIKNLSGNWFYDYNLLNKKDYEIKLEEGNRKRKGTTELKTM